MPIEGLCPYSLRRCLTQFIANREKRWSVGLGRRTALLTVSWLGDQLKQDPLIPFCDNLANPRHGGRQQRELARNPCTGLYLVVTLSELLSYLRICIHIGTGH